MATSLEIEAEAAAWLARRDKEEQSTAGAAAFNEWLQASDAHRVAYVRLESVWRATHRLSALGAHAAAGLAPIPPTAWRRAVIRVSGRSRLAAGLVAAVALLGGWHFWPRGPSYQTEVGGLASVPLADGSVVTLNTDSRIRVTVSETERRVTLERGEAFFEVAKDTRRPFIVHAADRQVIAVGTKFSVRRDGDAVRVVVTEGRVRIVRDGARDSMPDTQLSPGTITRTLSGDTLVDQRPLAEAEESLSWRRGFLVFRDIALVNAVAEFNRYNLRKLVIEDAATAAIHVGGSFRYANVEAFVRLLEQGFPVRAERRNDQIVLKAN